MRINIFGALCFVAFILTDAAEVTNEDINSPLVSYLLAKVQQLESKIMVRQSIRNARETTTDLLNCLLLLLTINSVTVHQLV